jgi:hypothetical protein
MKKAFVITMVIIFCLSHQIFAQQTKRVYIFQKNSSGDPVGDLRKWEGTQFSTIPFSSGAFFDFPINLPQTIKGDQEVYPNGTTGKNEKYNNWNYDKSVVANHHTFTISSQTDNLSSYFEETHSNITIKNNLENFDNLNGVNICYKGLEAVTSYDLTQNYPNPFNPSTTIRYQIPQDGIVTLKIYDILGSEVATLVNEEKVAGKYEVNFNASALASSVYIYKIQAGSFINSKKMLLLK